MTDASIATIFDADILGYFMDGGDNKEKGELGFHGFAANPEFRRYAPLALHRLNTPASLKAFADLVKAGGPGSWEQTEADRLQAKTDYRKCYTLQ